MSNEQKHIVTFETVVKIRHLVEETADLKGWTPGSPPLSFLVPAIGDIVFPGPEFIGSHEESDAPLLLCYIQAGDLLPYRLVSLRNPEVTVGADAREISGSLVIRGLERGHYDPRMETVA